MDWFKKFFVICKIKVYRVIFLKILIIVFFLLFGECNEFFILNWWSMIFLSMIIFYLENEDKCRWFWIRLMYV